LRLSVFSPSDLSSDINRFEISLSNKTKKSKDPDICKYFSVKVAYILQQWILCAVFMALVKHYHKRIKCIFMPATLLYLYVLDVC